MSTERERRKAEKRAKERKARAAAQSGRAKRVAAEQAAARVAEPGRAEKVSVAQAARWPLKDAWIGEGWDERGGELHAGLSRRHDDGRFAAVFFTVDRGDGKIVAGEVLLGVQEGEVNREVVKRAEPRAMVFCEPADVVALWDAASVKGVPADLRAAESFFDGVDADDATLDVRFGDEADEEDTETFERFDDGIFARFARWIGLR